MKSANIFKTGIPLFTVLLLIVTPFLSTTLLAYQELDSTNFKMVGVTTSGGGGVLESANYSLLSEIGRITADPRNYSTNYRIDQDPSVAFVAAQPTVRCFETDTTIPSGVIGLYNMNESSNGTCSGGGDVCDRSGLGNHLTSSETSIVDGYFDRGRYFDGTGSRLTITSMDTSSSDETLTISFWSKTDSEAFIQSFISDQGQHNDNGYIWIYRSSSTITLQFATQAGVNRSSASWSNYFDNNVWMHTTMVIDYGNNTVQLYKNGNQFGSTHNSSYEMQFPITPRIKIIGSYSTTGSHPLKGYLDEFIIYNRALEPSEVLDRYNKQTPTNCLSGPTELSDGGMVAICGGNGCYDKARFEIEPYTNPSDTLYMIQISEDDFVSDTRCIDGSTFKPKTLTSCDINDFRTESYWETEDFNIKGLEPETQYYIKISALHGDFTQSDYSIVASATTTSAYLFFDIDIATDSGYTAETSPPYSVTFSEADELVAGASAVTASSLIWLDVDSSSSQGMAVIQSGKNGGLYSATTTETITSTNLDLDGSLAEGFGLQSYYIDYKSSTYLGEITATTNYAGSGNVVGEVSTDAKMIYNGDGPINAGRMGIYLKARVASGRTPATDYSESISFVLVPRY